MGKMSREQHPLKIAIVTNVVPKYREGFYKRLFNEKNLKIDVYCQSEIPRTGLRTIKGYEQIKTVSFWGISKEVFVWQFLPFLKIFKKYDLVFVDGNPRYASHFILATLLRLLNKKVVLWTMAHSFNAKPLFEKIRLAWTRCFNNVFVYNDFEARVLKKQWPKHNIIGMNNGLDQEEIDSIISRWNKGKLSYWQIKNGLEAKLVVLSCARLTKKNQLDLFLNSLPDIVTQIPSIIWCIIGSGEEHQHLENMVKTLGMNNHVRLIGDLYDEQALAPWFLSSRLMIHPASIGLSLLHAFAYGVPVLTNDDFKRHGPEIVALEDGKNGLLFREGDATHLKEKVVSFFSNESVEANMRLAAKFSAQHKFNTGIMADNFLRMVTITMQ
ncbi:hypothetical protein BCY91_02150 [Pelobium manganitolerans]|uniref:Glycosyl transferase family 1 domain-containing protein n=1 Tax=Pelobium manganitolerans TaxID=1842495 RepID=A0A419SCN6_9SPHI|nr:glycosyltransferase [Pelobium manganitolerans]RKD20440.1 hypothetical protein BCY91_02150 [Pelobium manganitolerans]